MDGVVRENVHIAFESLRRAGRPAGRGVIGDDGRSRTTPGTVTPAGLLTLLLDFLPDPDPGVSNSRPSLLSTLSPAGNPHRRQIYFGAEAE